RSPVFIFHNWTPPTQLPVPNAGSCTHSQRTAVERHLLPQRSHLGSTRQPLVGGGAGHCDSFERGTGSPLAKKEMALLTSSLLLRLRRCGTDHLVRDRRQQPVLIFVEVRFQNPRIPLEVLEHAVLPL